MHTALLGLGNRPPFTIDANATAWKNAVITAGGTVSGFQLTVMSTYMTRLVNAGIWELTDDIWMYATETPLQALISLKQLRTATIVNSPTFTQQRG
jgi:hypothetical protein